MPVGKYVGNEGGGAWTSDKLCIQSRDFGNDLSRICIGKISIDYRIRGLEAGTSDTMLQRIKDSCGRTKSQINAWGWLLSAKRIDSNCSLF